MSNSERVLRLFIIFGADDEPQIKRAELPTAADQSAKPTQSRLASLIEAENIINVKLSPTYQPAAGPVPWGGTLVGEREDRN